MTRTLSLGFIPLLDAAPVIVAHELGFAEQEGVRLDLRRAANWSQLRDMLDIGTVDAAHMLSVMPVARALGLGGGLGEIDVLMVLSLNGQVIGLSRALAATTPALPFGDPGIGATLPTDGPLRFGVPFPFSMHALLLHYWLSRVAPDLDVTLHSIPPPRMAEALEAGEIDGFCVGEPWGTRAVQVAGARLILPGSAIWSQSPEKVLATRKGWAETEPEVTGALMRAIWRAGMWADENRDSLAELLALPRNLDTSSLHIEPALRGQVLPLARGTEAAVPQMLEFHAGLTNFPWRSQAAWIGNELAQRYGLPCGPAIASARATFRSDLYRLHLGPAGAPLPRSSDKAEGLLQQDESVPAVLGSLSLARNRFFDGAVFDPARNI